MKLFNWDTSNINYETWNKLLQIECFLSSEGVTCFSLMHIFECLSHISWYSGLFFLFLVRRCQHFPIMYFWLEGVSISWNVWLYFSYVMFGYASSLQRVSTNSTLFIIYLFQRSILFNFYLFPIVETVSSNLV